jgi:hypothetical protein
MIAVNGRVIAQGSQFSLTDVEVVTAKLILKMSGLIEQKAAEACKPHRLTDTTEVEFHLR